MDDLTRALFAIAGTDVPHPPGKQPAALKENRP
jgi:hypothetical protein